MARITGALTLVSENPSQSYRITILNSPAINAFALPGGYLYVTRGLLALATDASEVAAVLSHEMAHVTANHGIERQQREEAEVIASRVVAEVLSSEIAGKQALARSKLRLAAFSRNQELQADVIGVRMLGQAGYDPGRRRASLNPWPPSPAIRPATPIPRSTFVVTPQRAAARGAGAPSCPRVRHGRAGGRPRPRLLPRRH